MKQVSLAQKVGGVFGFTIVLALGAFAFNYFQSQKVRENVQDLGKAQHQMALANAISLRLTSVNLGYMDAIVDKDSGQVDQDIVDKHNSFYKWFNEKSPEYLASLKGELRADFEQSQKDLGVLKNTAEMLFASIRAKADASEFEKYDDVLDGTLDKVLERNNKAQKSFSSNYTSVLEQTEGVSKLAQWSQIISGVFLFITGSLALFFLLRSVNASLKTVTQNMRENFKELLINSLQMEKNSESLNHSASGQAASVQETTASAEEISSMVKNNTENAQRATQTAVRSSEVAHEGQSKLAQLMEAMKDIERSNQEIMSQMDRNNKDMLNLVTVISEVGDKTNIINDIVFQTKLLSFNASVEAARAGEQGKGFAVVAEEVGNLAQMSGKAANEISAVVEASIKNANEMAEATKRSVEGLLKTGKATIDRGNGVAQECQKVFEDIIGNIKEVSSGIEEVSTASIEQSSGVNQITMAMRQLDQATHETMNVAAASDQVAKAIKTQADNLKESLQALAAIAGEKLNLEEHTGSVSAKESKEVFDKEVPSEENKFDGEWEDVA